MIDTQGHVEDCRVADARASVLFLKECEIFYDLIVIVAGGEFLGKSFKGCICICGFFKVLFKAILVRSEAFVIFLFEEEGTIVCFTLSNFTGARVGFDKLLCCEFRPFRRLFRLDAGAGVLSAHVLIDHHLVVNVEIKLDVRAIITAVFRSLFENFVALFCHVFVAG